VDEVDGLSGVFEITPELVSGVCPVPWASATAGKASPAEAAIRLLARIGATPKRLLIERNLDCADC